MLLKGAALKNTDWVLGFCVYTGEETRLMMNSQKSRFKQSKMERLMNRLIIYIILVQALVCAMLAILSSFWYKNDESKYSYLPFDWLVGEAGVINYFSFFLLLNTLLPISLIVTLEIVKVCQALFIMSDYLIYSKERDRNAKVSSTSIIEELGQINYIFSDKTGTLTRNVMEFKFLHVGEELYGKIEELETRKADELER